MSRLEVENRVSLHIPKDETIARWNIKGDAGKITLYLPPLWEMATEPLADNEPIGRRFPDSQVLQDLALIGFMQEISSAYLAERICLDRAHQRIRMKGRTRCNPSCCIQGVASAMVTVIDEIWFEHNGYPF